VAKVWRSCRARH
jgi:site-specific recombinase XerD